MEVTDEDDAPAPRETPAAERTRAYFQQWCRERGEEYLPDLIRQSVSTHSDRVVTKYRNGSHFKEPVSKEEHIAEHPFPPQAGWFLDLPEALREYTRQQSASAAADYYLTNVGHTVWSALEQCRETGTPCVIEGLPGRGKSETLRAWAAVHRGEAILFTAPSYGTQSEVFHKLATAVGLPAASSREASEIRFRLGDLLRRSGLMLVVDEAQRLANHRASDGRPPLVEWIDSLVDEGVSVALCVTPQFARDLRQIEAKKGWALEQFTRRFAGNWTQLPDATTTEDLAALAQRLLPGIGATGWQTAAAYAHEFRDVSGLGDLVRDARQHAATAGRQVANGVDFDRALESRQKIEFALENSFSATNSGRKRSARQPRLAYPPPISPPAASRPAADSPDELCPREQAESVERHSRVDFGAFNRPLNSPVSSRLQAPDLGQPAEIVSLVEA